MRNFLFETQQERKNMAKSYSTRVLTFLMLISLMAVALNLLSTAEAEINKKKPRRDVPLVNGLSWSFYQKACPKVEKIIRKELKKVFKRDIGLAAAILRIHFHDCFVQVYLSFFLFSFFVDLYLNLGRDTNLKFSKLLRLCLTFFFLL